MTSFNSGVQPQNRTPQSIGFLLLDNFTLISLASAIEPLRMANQLSGRELYRWSTLSADGSQVWASDGLQVTPDASMHKAPALDMVIVCGGIGIQRTVTREHVSWLQSQARQSRRLGAVCTETAVDLKKLINLKAERDDSSDPVQVTRKSADSLAAEDTFHAEP